MALPLNSDGALYKKEGMVQVLQDMHFHTSSKRLMQ